ncbi:hypothetical protein BDQ94DRAFT_74135 [Aspergillus welwitschiae]|uniref:Uncharacterized protein n=1 Tax=Aspergillus welwitschiae TaxID=1341132 RepID=A0A3F3QFX3_9EURO|nr:hypothetical protein BDQ94DRAFT_74135 [Aspergillus welwitschiae]RDH38178.1 hypothetical protein BDQ94DRAFT_74135 [Aspergillus welwitschiae]
MLSSLLSQGAAVSLAVLSLLPSPVAAEIFEKLSGVPNGELQTPILHFEPHTDVIPSNTTRLEIRQQSSRQRDYSLANRPSAERCRRFRTSRDGYVHPRTRRLWKAFPHPR